MLNNFKSLFVNLWSENTHFTVFVMGIGAEQFLNPFTFYQIILLISECHGNLRACAQAACSGVLLGTLD